MDFGVSLTSSDGSLTTATWSDPPSTSPPAPSRLNGNPLYPPRYHRVQLPAFGHSATLIVQAIVGGVTAPVDSALGGRLFTMALAEWSGLAPPFLVFTPGQSSLLQISFLNRTETKNQGHFLLSVRRQGGGSLGIHVDVEA